VSIVLLDEIMLQGRYAPFHVNSVGGEKGIQDRMKGVYPTSLIEDVFYEKWKTVWSERQSRRKHGGRRGVM
jgi:hypothetical protein